MEKELLETRVEPHFLPPGSIEHVWLTDELPPLPLTTGVLVFFFVEIKYCLHMERMTTDMMLKSQADI